MDGQTKTLQEVWAAKVNTLWQHVSWQTPREEADRLRREAVQACHALHATANPAYRERCRRERIGERLELAQLPLVAFPEEIYKAYSQKQRADGRKLGVFCEQDVPLLVEHLNQYLVHPLTIDGLRNSYMGWTNIRGGLDRLRKDLRMAQGVLLVTSSGTTGSAISLIPMDQAALEMQRRVYARLFREATIVPGYGPIEPEQHCMVAHSPLSGSMMLAVAFELQTRGFGERAFMTIPAHVHTRELRWRAGVYAGPGGRLLGLAMKPLQRVGGKRTSRLAVENLLIALRKAEAWGLRTAVAGNSWMAYSALKELEALLEDEIARGAKKPGDHLVDLAPGSLLVYGGGNKSGLNVTEDEITALYHKLIGGLDKVVDVYNQSEGYVSAIRCAQGNYHLDSHSECFVVDGYLAYFDPRHGTRLPAIVTGDVVGTIHEEPCPCGAPTRYFRQIQRDDQKRGSKGCAAALAEYA